MAADDTIAAIATPVGAAGIGVVRISGPEAVAAAERIIAAPKQPVDSWRSHTAHHVTLVDPSFGEPIDEAVVTVFRAPSSYTGEDVVEISCHGGTAILRSVLGAVLAAGTRPAEPGEFTRRAFLNGRLDLAQAEAVNDLIRAKSDGARRAALTQLSGGLSRRVGDIRSSLLGLIASIEASVDFPEDVPEPAGERVTGGIRSAIEQIRALADSFKAGRIYREGLRVAIAGRVNVGKSSILNALLRFSRAIVTPIPGTTRDLIEESLEIRGIPIVAIDTAGIRQTDDPVEKIGVELTGRALASADLVLFVADISEGMIERDVELIQQIEDKPAVVVLNKIDLLSEKARGLVTKEYYGRLGRSFPIVQTCAFSGQGIDQLEEEIARAAAAGLAPESALVTNARHQAALVSALESLFRAAEGAQSGEPLDLISIDLTAAVNSLGLITGESAADDLLDRIFSEFCIGK